jgi:lipoprotein signal peptidase
MIHFRTLLCFLVIVALDQALKFESTAHQTNRLDGLAHTWERVERMYSPVEFQRENGQRYIFNYGPKGAPPALGKHLALRYSEDELELPWLAERPGLRRWAWGLFSVGITLFLALATLQRKLVRVGLVLIAAGLVSDALDLSFQGFNIRIAEVANVLGWTFRFNLADVVFLAGSIILLNIFRQAAASRHRGEQRVTWK